MQQQPRNLIKLITQWQGRAFRAAMNIAFMVPSDGHHGQYPSEPCINTTQQHEKTNRCSSPVPSFPLSVQ